MRFRKVTVALAVGLLVLSTSACDGLSKHDTSDLKIWEKKPCDWSTADLAAQVVVQPVDSSNVAAAAPAVAKGAGGVILFGPNPSQNLKDQLAVLVGQAPRGRTPFVMSDEEGGPVQRLAKLIGAFPSAHEMSALTAKQVQQQGDALGSKLKGLGVTMDLAPVLDLDSQAVEPGRANAVGTRSFGSDPQKTAQSGVAFAKGLKNAGVLPVVKHFPGLGGSTGGNTDYVAARTKPWAQLQQEGLVPFKTAIQEGLPAVMTANAVVPDLTDKPATISPEVTRFLREDLGFEGLIVTDTLTAGALSSLGITPEAAAVAALNAGADLLLFGSASTNPAKFDAMVAAIVAAVDSGTLPRQRLVDSVNRVLETKKLSTCGS